MNYINNEIETNTNVNRNILNNSFYSIINVIDDDQENINIITEENDIINMINKYYCPKTTIIEYKKNKKNKNNKGKTTINNNNDKANYKENNKKDRFIKDEHNQNNENNNNSPEKPNDNSGINKINIHNINYINQPLYPLVTNRLNINPVNLRIFNPIGDGNCLFRSISRFIYDSEDLYMRVRREIYEAALLSINSYPDINIELVLKQKLGFYISGTMYQKLWKMVFLVGN